MPDQHQSGKAEALRRIDQKQYTDAATPTAAVYPSRGGNAATLGGYSASLLPRPNTIPVLDDQAFLHPDLFPMFAISGTQATGHHGQQYVGPTSYLAEPISSDADYIMVLAPIFENYDSAYLSHYSVPSEKIWIVGDVIPTGRYFKYPV